MDRLLPSIRRSGRALIILAVAALSGCAASIEDVDQFTGQIPPGMGILVVVVDTTVAVPILRLSRPGDTFSAIAARDIAPGRSMHLVLLPAGRYTWTRAELPCNRTPSRFAPPCIFLALDRDKRTRYTFDIKAGTVNYPGDLVLMYSWGYRSELVDRTAMALRDLVASQRDTINRFGFVYVGPGDDTFYSYYSSLVPATGAKP